MKSRRHFEFYTLGPYGILVLLTVQTKGVEPGAFPGGLGSNLSHDRSRTADMAGHHNSFQAERVGRVLQLLNRILRGMHRNRGSRRHAVGILTEDLGIQGVERRAVRPPELLIIQMRKIEAECRVKYREVDPHFIQAFLQQFGHAGRGPVQPVFRQQRPPWQAEASALSALFGRTFIPAAALAPTRQIALQYERATDLSQIVVRGRLKLDSMAV